MKTKTFYISTPIYYPSGKPHIGHAYSTILADVINRYKKSIGYETFFVTGTDEHGKKIEENAKKHNMNVLDYLQENVNCFKQLWNKLGIEFDHFSRTTDKHHIETIQKIFSIYLKKNLIYLSEWNGLYCISCEENFTNKDAVKKDNNFFCNFGHKLIEIKEESYFYKIKNDEKWISSFFDKEHDFIYPLARVNELKNNFINKGLNDLSVSRSSFSWGIPILENKKHVVYVWMDALFNYLTALNFLTPNDKLYQKFWNHDNAEIVHVLSKEITRFHCIYWPIFLKNLNVKLPTKIISHGWILSNNTKMSKSLNNVIDPNEFILKYGRDALRYYLMKEISLNNDSTFSEESLLAIYNGDLANNYGNLVSRTIGMAKKYNAGKIKSLSKTTLKSEQAIVNLIYKTNEENTKFVNDFQINKILNNTQELINHANKLIEETKPWELFKTNKTQQIDNLLHILTKIIEVSSFWLAPILIDGVKTVISQTNISLSFEQLNNLDSVDNLELLESTPIYKRI